MAAIIIIGAGGPKGEQDYRSGTEAQGPGRFTDDQIETDRNAPREGPSRGEQDYRSTDIPDMDTGQDESRSQRFERGQAQRAFGTSPMQRSSFRSMSR